VFPSNCHVEFEVLWNLFQLGKFDEFQIHFNMEQRYGGYDFSAETMRETNTVPENRGPNTHPEMVSPSAGCRRRLGLPVATRRMISRTRASLSRRSKANISPQRRGPNIPRHCRHRGRDHLSASHNVSICLPVCGS